jgi:macrodomain Ter protein organizer (MatP/YcbG family)
MDTTKWKSILVPREMYLEVKEAAKREGRTISGQLCYAYEKAKRKTKTATDKEQVPTRFAPK